MPSTVPIIFITKKKMTQMQYTSLKGLANA